MSIALLMAAALSLNGEWRLDYRFEEERGEWSTVRTQVPGDGYIALQEAGVLPDLTIGTNAWGALKYEQCEWKYSRTFDAPQLKPGERAMLTFDGVDTRATYVLNGETIGKSDNMFVPHRFDVTDRLKQKENVLEVLIASPLGRDLLNVLGRSRVGGTDVEGIRKAQHSFGWDIMPRIVCGGIWRDVRIDILPPERFGDVFWIVERVDAKRRTADVRVQCQVVAPRRWLHRARLKVSLSRGGKVAAECEHPLRYAQMLGTLMERSGTRVYLVNTGWTGGPYGVGSRMDLPSTRLMVTACLEGSIEDAKFVHDPVFNVDVPQRVDGVDPKVLNPRNTWADKDAYDVAARKLAKMFEDNAAKKYPDMAPEVRAAGPHSS